MKIKTQYNIANCKARVVIKKEMCAMSCYLCNTNKGNQFVVFNAGYTCLKNPKTFN